MPIAYGAAFIATLILNVDLIWRFSTRPEFYIDFVHYLVILFWVIANGLWAFGEMVANTDATEDQFRRYSWPQWQLIHGTNFEYRYAAGWIFLLSGLVLLSFYVHWMVVSIRRKLPPYGDTDMSGQFDLV